MQSHPESAGKGKEEEREDNEPGAGRPVRSPTTPNWCRSEIRQHNHGDQFGHDQIEGKPPRK